MSSELERIITEMMSDRLGVPFDILARTVYGEPTDPVADIRLAQEKLESLYGSRSAE